MSAATCRACGAQFDRRHRRNYCNDCHCQTAVYRFVCPDGRSYVGSTHDLGTRSVKGLLRNNRRIKAALEKYPPETWRFEILERLPSGRPFQEAVEAEQRHIERLGTLNPKRGFNVNAAVGGSVPGLRAQQALQILARGVTVRLSDEASTPAHVDRPSTENANVG
jgi:hypothetical protein